MSDVEMSPLGRLVRKLGALIDVTRTIDRNSDDGAYHHQGGEISYVFDTNIVQMFLEPYKNPRFAQVFHSPLWSSEGRQDAQLNAQSCLLASEYLMSGQLPGQAIGRRAGRWYMTRKHHREIKQQVNHLSLRGKDLAGRLKNDTDLADYAMKKLAALNAVLALEPNGDRKPFIKLAERRLLSTISLEGLESLPQEQFRDWAIGLRSSEACRLLSQDEILEPADQVARYMSSKIASRFMELEDFLKPSSQDWDQIREEQDRWRREISLLMKNRDVKVKTDQALSADCEALALVNWGNRQTESWNRRIVFVTGDRMLVDACRQRFVNDPQQQFFFARPVSHFAPIFNPTSAHSQLSAKEAFKRLQEVLESAMVPLNLGLLAGQERDRRLRARDDFTLRVSRAPDSMESVLKQFFPKTQDEKWVADQEKSLDALVHELREVEVLMLEAFPRLVAERLDKERERFLREATSAGIDVLANAIDERYALARTASFRFSLQMMSDALDEFLLRTETGDSISQRAAVQVRLSFAENPQEYFDYESTVAWLRKMSPDERQQTVERLIKNPERLFALVALLAFNLEAWKDAERYADLAARTALEAKGYDDADRERLKHELYEHLYLKAKSLRFRLADYLPEEGLNYVDVWWKWMRLAEDTLADCIEHHTAEQEPARLLRDVSERAALRIAYCEWLAFGNLARLKPTEKAINEAAKAFDKSVADLNFCARLSREPQIMARMFDSNYNGAAREIVTAARRQFNANIHAAWLTAKRFAEKWPEHSSTFADAAMQLPFAEEIEWPNRPVIVDAYVASFHEQWSIVDQISTDGLSLALDIVVIKGLKQLAYEAHSRSRESA